MKMLSALLLALLCGIASAQSIDSGEVSTPRISTKSPARYVVITNFQGSVGNGATLLRQVYPFAGGGRLVDVVIHQQAAGTVGTSWTLDVKNQAGTSLLSQVGVMTRAADRASLDIKGDIALCSGCTRPVVKADGTENIAKGGYIEVFTTETGGYSTHPTIIVAFIFEPNQ